MSYELTQLHHITSDELKLLQNYRLLCNESKVAIWSLIELQARNDNPTHEGGNVVPFLAAQAV